MFSYIDKTTGLKVHYTAEDAMYEMWRQQHEDMLEVERQDQQYLEEISKMFTDDYPWHTVLGKKEFVINNGVMRQYSVLVFDTSQVEDSYTISLPLYYINTAAEVLEQLGIPSEKPLSIDMHTISFKQSDKELAYKFFNHLATETEVIHTPYIEEDDDLPF